MFKMFQKIKGIVMGTEKKIDTTKGEKKRKSTMSNK